ncbi:uncharacterized protein KY384_002835 [Bacidia gigantensis]|uniref:uncharacterized protein n=1 Tax=Bacidia gigantensis TaxID=2732470 RepID=UPI001D04D310|nr:uncharacterized protein KY384_002835 [Bacidia gigantensis]KAG8532350.1 hypothetical protein KY384_002835 [Bacidia gigantensis]
MKFPLHLVLSATIPAHVLADILIGQATALDWSGTVGCFSAVTIGMAPASAFTCHNVGEFDSSDGVMAGQDDPESEMFEFKLEDKFCHAGWVTFTPLNWE